MTGELTDQVLCDGMLKNKTYFNALKEHINMVPRKPVYNHDRLVLQSTENSEAGGYFEDPKIEARTNTGGLFTPKK